MQSTQERSLIQRSIAFIYKKYPLVESIVHAIHTQGGNVILVGGAVRDLFLGLPMHDIDCEVYGISLEQQEKIIRAFGPVSMIGTAFGVLKVHGLDVDWSIPRCDSAGRKPSVKVNPFMSYEDAFRRRDLTINAMGIDLQTGELIDPYGGRADLEQRILRAPDITKFAEDPLRLYRVMQFIGRFEATVDPQLAALCADMDIGAVSRERIEGEFEKLLLQSVRPSRGLRWLRDIGKLQEILPELWGTIDVPQRPDFHPEGDVFEHSMQALDAAAAIARSYDDGRTKMLLLYAALCHDLGKQDVTVWKDDRWRSTGHAQAGVPRTKAMLSRITGKKKIIAAVCLLVEHHMAPGMYAKEHAKPVTYKKLAYALSPTVTVALLADLAFADRRGRNAQSHEPLVNDDEYVVAFIAQAKKLGVFEAPVKPLLYGSDLLDTGVTGAELGRLLAHAYEVQLCYDIHDKDELKRRVLDDMKNR